MRLAWVVDGDLDQISGGYLYDRIVVDFLRSRDVDVDVISLPKAPYLRRLMAGAESALDRLDMVPFDGVIEDELSHPALIRANRRLAHRAPRLRRIALVHHLRSSEPRNWALNAFYRFIERAYLRTVHGFVFNSHSTRTAVQRLAGDGAPWVVAVPGPDRLGRFVSPDSIEARAQVAGPLRVLFVGNWIPRKGLLTLIDAMALLPDGVAALTVVGDPEADPAYAAHVRRRIRRLGLQVVVRGALGRREISQVMEAHHVLAVPSSHEGYGMAYLEGMAHGLPPITGMAGGASEFVRVGENGYRVDPEDPAGLAARLLALAEDRRLLARVSQAALRTYQAHPGWDAAGATILRFLEKVVGPSSAGGDPPSELRANVLSSDEPQGRHPSSSPEVRNEP